MEETKTQTAWGACSRCEKRVRVTHATSKPNPVCRPCRKIAPEPGRRWAATFSAVCQVCGDLFTRRIGTHTSPRVCDKAGCSAHDIPRPCAGCSTPVVSRSTVVVRCADCAAVHKRERWQVKNRKRRATLRSVPSEPYTTAAVAERDMFMCQLCFDPVDLTLTSPHPDSPSIDHVVPLAAGGSDTPDNVQLAHRWCNTSKGTRLMTEEAG